jgi:multiple sugar transport system permease protein
MKNREKTLYFILHIFLISFAIIMVLPFVWMILTSIKTVVEIMKVPPKLLPEDPQWSNYKEIFSEIPFMKYYYNTIVVVIMRTGSQLFLCSLGGFAFAKLKFKGRDAIFFICLCILMVPTQMILIPNYIIMQKLQCLNTITSVALPGMFSAFGIFLMRQAFLSLPDEIIEAGRVDGCNYFQIYYKLLLPLVKPAMSALGIFTLIYSWKDFLWPLIVTSTDQVRVLSVGIALLQGQYSSEFHLIMAANVLATVPVLIIFIFLQKYFVEGIAFSGLKQ